MNLADDVNADGRADVVCIADGAVMIWESKIENTNIYHSSSKWMDDKFGFCDFQDKRVQHPLILISVFVLIQIVYFSLSSLKHKRNSTSNWPY